MSSKHKKMKENFEISTAPNVYYQNFFNKFPEIETLAISEWKTLHLLAHFCKRYESVYKVKYSFKFNSTPSKCYEIFTIKKIAGMLGTTDPVTIKQYIDWIFDSKVGNAKKRITAIGFMAGDHHINEYKFNNIKINTITRSKPLPPTLLSIVQIYGIDNCTTYGALSFLFQSVDDDTYGPLFVELTKAGLDTDSLRNIK